ncbi:hypothetical protein CFN78_06030 [Amycolatopsis antarctica]|uniref:DUF3558 domain-containing protein n=1 Tax=Amycolatopsis antarctica TaxID=1854586 RepID=A0A263D6P6_9PSEU|nr:hypothetical protein CFN78_06030 [Amycolatopsis antarctica]
MVRFAVLLPLLLAGCGGAVAGTAVPDASVAAPLTRAVFGDLRSIDPCGMTAPDTFAGIGPARTLARTSMDDCTFAVTVQGQNVEIRIGLLLPESELAEDVTDVRSLPGNVRLVQKPETDEACERYLVLSDGLAVSAVADPQNSSVSLDRAQVCGVAEAGLTGVHRAATAGTITHWDPAPNSFVRLSPCSLVPGAELARRTGIAEKDTTLLPAEHQCRWGPAGSEQANVQLDFFVGKVVNDTTGTIPAPEDVAGRPTIVLLSQSDSVKVCNAYTDNIPYQLGIEDEIERAAVRVLLPGSDERDPCAIARDTAALAWPRLPAAGGN